MDSGWRLDALHQKLPRRTGEWTRDVAGERRTLRAGYSASEPLTMFAERIAPDVEFDFTAVYPDRPVLRGTDAVLRFIDEGPWGGTIRFEPERFFDVDDERVLVFVRVTAIGQESGVAAEARAAHEFTIRDGLLVLFKAYHDRSEALEAAGLAE